MGVHRKLTAAAIASLALAAAAGAEELSVTAGAMKIVDGELRFSGSVQVEGETLSLDAESLLVDGDDYHASGQPALLVVADSQATVSVSGPEILFSVETKVARMDAGGIIMRGGMRVESGSLLLDIGDSLLSASSGVSISDGDMAASGRAARLSGGRDALRVELEGSPASLDLPTEGGEILTATAETISYDQSRGLVNLDGGARASLGQEDFSGETITYDLRKATFAAEPVEGGKVRATIKTR